MTLGESWEMLVLINVAKICEVNIVYVCISEIKLPLLCFLRFSGSGNVQLNLPICTNGKTWNNNNQGLTKTRTGPDRRRTEFTETRTEPDRTGL